jgi:lactoylglutathione lyase
MTSLTVSPGYRAAAPHSNSASSSQHQNRFLIDDPTHTNMKYLHTMVRVTNLDESLRFYRDALGLTVVRQKDYPQGRFTLVYLAAPGDPQSELELTHNWDPEPYTGGRNFGHVAYAVDNIYATCERLQAHGVVILRPPRDGRMAFVRSPDQISVELLQAGEALPPQQPWCDMPNIGHW